MVPGILDLHENPFVEASRELVDLVSQHDFPFQLYYHERTLKEWRDTLDVIRDHLAAVRWRQDLSRAAVLSGRLTGVELRFHQRNAEKPIGCGSSTGTLTGA